GREGGVARGGRPGGPEGGPVGRAIDPRPGYHVDSLLVDGEPMHATDALVLRDVVENRSIRAAFALNEYLLVSSAGTHAHISPEGPVIVKHGGSQAYALTADSGYSVREVMIDGKPVRASGSYTLSSVRDNHTIVARV